MLNETGLRWSDEFVRHKILDIIRRSGAARYDHPFGRVKAERSGPTCCMPADGVSAPESRAWEIVDLPAPHLPAASEHPHPFPQTDLTAAERR